MAQRQRGKGDPGRLVKQTGHSNEGQSLALGARGCSPEIHSRRSWSAAQPSAGPETKMVPASKLARVVTGLDQLRPPE